MTRRVSTARKMMNANVVNKHNSWSDHPIIIAASSSAATILLCLAIFSELVLPLRTAELELEVSRMKETQVKLSSQLTEVSTRFETADKELAEAKEQVADLKSQLLEVRSGTLFSPGSAYPVGLGMVNIGMPIEGISKIFPKNEIKIDPDSPDTITIYLTDSPFQRITYFSKEGKVSHFSVSLPIINDFPEGFLQRKLIDAFGTPKTAGRKGFFYWSIAGGMNLYKDDEDSVLIMDKNFKPSYWPDLDE